MDSHSQAKATQGKEKFGLRKSAMNGKEGERQAPNTRAVTEFCA